MPSEKSNQIRDVNALKLNNNLESPSNDTYVAQCLSCKPIKAYRETDKKLLIIASILSCIFLIAEIIGGILSNSLAIAADVGHLVTDLAAFLINLLAIYISGKRKTESMTFGFYRAETLGALATILMLWILVGVMFYLALKRLVFHDYEIDGTAMFITAAVGLPVNIILVFVLLSGNICNKSNSDGMIPQKQLGLKSAIIHVTGDLLYSIGLLFSSIIVFLKPEYKIADPICSLIFSFLVIITTFHIIRDIIQVLMEGFPRHLQFQTVYETLLTMPRIIDIHHLRIWSLSLDKVALSAHLVIKKGDNPTEVLKEASIKVSQTFDIFESTLQVEEAGETETMCTLCA